MAMNEFGEGAVVQQSLIESNGDWHMERAIAHFKRSHPTRIQSLRVIVVDKDLNEIRVLEANFPDARILICHFHVIKYLKEMRAKPEFGKLSAEDASQIDGAVHKMVYALSEDNYNEAHDSLKGICERCGINTFFAYFEKNWDASRDRWVLYLRATLPHFKNHTNNRLESFFGKLKESVDGSMSMATCIKSLVAYDRRKENEYRYRVSRIGQFVNCNYDEEMRNVLRFTTHYVAGQIEHQMLLDACTKLLPVGNTAHAAISIDDSQTNENQGGVGTTGQGTVETLIIKDVGNFSRKQIETFKRVQNLKAQVQLGLDMHKSLVQDALPTLPAEYHDLASKVATDVLAAYPYKCIDTLPNYPDFHYAMLYRATPPVWLNDATIRALCLRLCGDYPTCRFTGFQPATTWSKRTRNADEVVVDAAIRDLVIQQANEEGVETVMLPLNFMNYHWCCVTVMVIQKRIFYYDPLNQGPYMNAAKAVATHLKLAELQGYDVIPQNNPLQFDLFSCGVYVCWMFIRQVCQGAHPDMSKTSLTRRRFELFYYLLTGRLLTVEASKATPTATDDGTEEKLPPSRTDDEAGGDEELPPTQVAQ
ncbi:hypothetical protein F444_23180 [Phytophthora nicotianae P1976]|uniref:Ubiquitin-like protease family profile domain-containing protein n=1 Tax=Phytophthora nicotianae P1976 TaxID=1317066 RepID=A0A080YVN5_PHYNI|nr:hypothetical protein F444_23180 [Phytophthora nicotianae P1976]